MDIADRNRYEVLSERNGDDGEAAVAEVSQANEVVEVMVDSGAGRSVWPKEWRTGGTQ